MKTHRGGIFPSTPSLIRTLLRTIKYYELKFRGDERFYPIKRPFCTSLLSYREEPPVQKNDYDRFKSNALKS